VSPLIRAIPRQGKGSIVNISSSYGKVGDPTAAVYVGSKYAVEGITKSAAIEVAGTGVRVNIVDPGPTETRMFNSFAQTQENKANFLETHIPTKRIGTPEEIANAIVFIASDNASYNHRCIPGGGRNDSRLILMPNMKEKQVKLPTPDYPDGIDSQQEHPPSRKATAHR
jgi:NAD(P)-dependent dehydrogenase (short-subunit alcohol dehydrogenase family)